MDTSTVLKYFIRIFSALLILPLHELAHAWMANKLGDDTAKQQGRLTLNPFAHFDLIGGLLLIIFGFGWAKPVPVNPMRFNRMYNECIETKNGKKKVIRHGISMRKGMALTAAAGPASNLIIAIIGMLLFRLVDSAKLSSAFLTTFSLGYLPQDSALKPYFYLCMMLFYFVYINLSLAFFNLLPVYPLDGSRILSAFLSPAAEQKFRQLSRYSFILLLVVVYCGGNLLSSLINLVFNGLLYVTDWIPSLFA